MISLSGGVLFDSGSAQIKEEAKPILDKIGQILTRYAQSTIEIEGHTDNVPIHNSKFADNNELSSFRALSVFNYFMETTFLDPAKIKHSAWANMFRLPTTLQKREGHKTAVSKSRYIIHSVRVSRRR